MTPIRAPKNDRVYADLTLELAYDHPIALVIRGLIDKHRASHRVGGHADMTLPQTPLTITLGNESAELLLNEMSDVEYRDGGSMRIKTMWQTRSRWSL
jgi:hypothetical protein